MEILTKGMIKWYCYILPFCLLEKRMYIHIIRKEVKYYGNDKKSDWIWKEKNETMYAPKGHEIKHHQVVLKPNTLKIER